MKNINYNFCYIVSIVFFYVSCNKDDEFVQTFDYYDFQDVVIKYPSDTTLRDTVSFGITPTSTNDFSIYTFYDNEYGLADTDYTNKVCQVRLYSPYQSMNLGFCGYCILSSTFNSSIKPNDIGPSSGHNISNWSTGGNLVLNFKGPNCVICYSNGERYLQLRKKIRQWTFKGYADAVYAGWIRCTIYSDSIVFHDCAFSKQRNVSIKAGQH